MSDFLSPPNRLQPAVLSLLRFVTGLVYLEHGCAKLWGFPFVASYAHGLPPLLLAAGIIEFFGGALLCVGLLTRPVAFLASGEMAIGYFLEHFPKSPAHPLINGGGLAIMFCFIFFYLSFAGGGSVSLDRVIAGPRSWLAGPVAGSEVA